MNVTPLSSETAVRLADFPTLCEALDHAATGATGVNFFDARGTLYSSTPYAELRDQALDLARRLAGLGIAQGGRVALVADTTPDFVRFFWACQYAGLVPVPLPATMNAGGHAAYVAQLRQLIDNCGAAAAMAPPDWLGFLREATEGMPLRLIGAPADFDRLPRSDADLPASPPTAPPISSTPPAARAFRAAW